MSPTRDGAQVGATRGSICEGYAVSMHSFVERARTVDQRQQHQQHREPPSRFQSRPTFPAPFVTVPTTPGSVSCNSTDATAKVVVSPWRQARKGLDFPLNFLAPELLMLAGIQAGPETERYIEIRGAIGALMNID